MPAPHEIVASPLTVYLAPTGTTFPVVDAAPSGSWIKLGTEGDLNYSDDGVTVNHSGSTETFTGAGSSRPRKAWRTEEGLSVGFTLVDLSPAQYAKILDEATVTVTAASNSVPGTSEFDLARDVNVKTWSLLARGESSVDNGLAAQLQIETVYQSAEPEVAFKKGEPAGLEVEFTALEAAAGDWAKWVIQTAPKTA